MSLATSIFRITGPAFIIVLGFTLCGCMATRKYMSDIDRKFSFQTSEPTHALVGEVERSFGRQVIVKINSAWEPSHFGESYVDELGNPTIELNATTGLTDSNAAHELMHLLMKSEGYLGLRFSLQKADSSAGNQEWLPWISFHLRDPIQHFIFYPRMRKMGIAPGSDIEREFRDVVTTGEFKELKEASRFEALALYYLKAKIEITSPELLKRLDELYVAKWDEEMVMGQRLYDMISKSPSQTPDNEMVLFVNCANLLLREKQKVQFEIVGHEAILKGTFLEKFAVVRLKPI